MSPDEQSPALRRIGGSERRQIISSIHALIAENVATFVDDLQTFWDYTPDRATEVAARMARDFWYETVDEAIGVGITRRRER
jgi:hypothetical protein